MTKITLLGGLAAVLIGSMNLLAQGQGPGQGPGGGRRNRGQGGNFDPAQAQQQRMDRYKEAFGITNEDEWKVIGAAIEKVDAASREARSFGGGMMRMGRGRGGGAPGAAVPDASAAGQNPTRRQFGPQRLPEEEGLQAALDNNAPNEEIKTKLAALREARKAKQAVLEKAQADLQKLLTVKQEAIAVSMGLLR